MSDALDAMFGGRDVIVGSKSHDVIADTTKMNETTTWTHKARVNVGQQVFRRQESECKSDLSTSREASFGD